MMVENWFLVVLAFIWIIIAVVQDFRKKEVANWLNFSLIVIALSYRAFISVFFWNYMYLVWGLAGFAVFFILANVFYYGRVFAGGDAKLLMGLGAVMGFSLLLYENLQILLYFLFLLLFCGSIYGLFYSLVLSCKNKEKFSREFLKQFGKNKRLILVFLIPAIFLTALFLIIGEYLFILLPAIIFFFPFLFIYAKTIEESCMVKEVKAATLTVGDWLYKEVRVRGKKIKPSWEGLTAEDLRVLRKSKKKVLVKQGIPFTPAFLLAFIILILLRYSYWSFW
jgi:Flp pilus assembly protein protease CpaA